MAVVQLLLQEHADVSICREVCTLTVIAACKYSGAGEGLRILGIFCALLYTTLGVYMCPPVSREVEGIGGICSSQCDVVLQC